MQYTVYNVIISQKSCISQLASYYSMNIIKLIAIPYPYSYEQHSCCSMQQPQGDEEFKPGATVPPASA